MKDYIIVGCDLHDKILNIRLAHNLDGAERLTFANSHRGRADLIAELKRRAGGARIVLAYEAGPHGFGLHDVLADAGIDCRVLAPTKIARSVRQKRSKNDDSDALHLLGLLRAHLLAGNDLPEVWVPDRQTRDDREVVRARLDIGDRIVALKNEIHALLKRCDLKKPAGVGGNWTGRHRAWLAGLCKDSGGLGWGAARNLESLLEMLVSLEEQAGSLGQLVEALSRAPRYEAAVEELTCEAGVGVLTAMVYLTEMGDLGRFSNRRQVASYVGLAPSMAESGKSGERKGHITHQGSFRVRKVLCQAVWARVRVDENARRAYRRVVARNPKHKKIAVVAMMRRLDIRLWHRGLEAQRQARAC